MADGAAAGPWLRRIEERINGDGPRRVELNAVLGAAPRVHLAGPTPPDAAVAARRAALLAQYPLNEMHGLCQGWRGQRERIAVQTCDFAELQARRQLARERGLPPPEPLSACGVAPCASARVLLMQRRSPHSATYPGALHVFGGAYAAPEPRGHFARPGDRDSLDFTLVREVFDECGALVRPGGVPLLLAQESDTGFVMLAYLGLRIARTQLARMQGQDEGALLRIGFDELPERLRDGAGWTPSARAQTLLWLALGAPGAGKAATFAGRPARAAFDHVINSPL